MGSLDFLRERQLRQHGVIGVSGIDKDVAIRLRYIGTGTVTSVTTTTAVDITTVTVVGTTTTTKVYDFATYSTVGLLVDKINLNGIFEAKVLDTLRSKATASQFIDGAITSGTFYGKTVWDVKLDSSACDYIAYRLCYDRGFEKANKNNHRVHLKEILYAINLSGVTASTVTVYDTCYTGYPKQEESVFSLATVDTTATTIRWNAGKDKLTAKEDHDLVIIIPDADDLTDTAAYMRISGFIE